MHSLRSAFLAVILSAPLMTTSTAAEDSLRLDKYAPAASYMDPELHHTVWVTVTAEENCTPASELPDHAAETWALQRAQSTSPATITSSYSKVPIDGGSSTEPVKAAASASTSLSVKKSASQITASTRSQEGIIAQSEECVKQQNKTMEQKQKKTAKTTIHSASVITGDPITKTTVVHAAAAATGLNGTISHAACNCTLNNATAAAANASMNTTKLNSLNSTAIQNSTVSTSVRINFSNNTMPMSIKTVTVDRCDMSATEMQAAASTSVANATSTNKAAASDLGSIHKVNSTIMAELTTTAPVETSTPIAAAAANTTMNHTTAGHTNTVNSTLATVAKMGANSTALHANTQSIIGSVSAKTTVTPTAQFANVANATTSGGNNNSSTIAEQAAASFQYNDTVWITTTDYMTQERPVVVVVETPTNTIYLEPESDSMHAKATGTQVAQTSIRSVQYQIRTTKTRTGTVREPQMGVVASTMSSLPSQNVNAMQTHDALTPIVGPVAGWYPTNLVTQRTPYQAPAIHFRTDAPLA